MQSINALGLSKNTVHMLNYLSCPQKLLRETSAPVHQHLSDEHQRPHRCRGGAPGYAQGLHTHLSTHTHAHTHTLVHTHTDTQVKQTWMHCLDSSLGSHDRSAPAPLKRTKRLSPSCPFPCRRSETWTLPTTPARSWSRQWGSFSTATSLRMRGGTDAWRDMWRGTACTFLWLHFIVSSLICIFRFVTKLLEDLVFFVCVVPNNGQDVLSVVTSTPNRERQKLMREQNILAQVGTSTQAQIQKCFFTKLFSFLFIIVRSVPVPSDLRHPEGSVHGSGRGSDAQVGGFGRPALRSLQVHVEALLPGATPLPAGLSQEPGMFSSSCTSLTSSIHWVHPLVWLPQGCGEAEGQRMDLRFHDMFQKQGMRANTYEVIRKSVNRRQYSRYRMWFLWGGFNLYSDCRWYFQDKGDENVFLVFFKMRFWLFFWEIISLTTAAVTMPSIKKTKASSNSL